MHVEAPPPDGAAERSQPGRLVVDERRAAPRLPLAVRDRVSGGGRGSVRLRARVAGALLGTLSPVAVPEPGAGGGLAYTAWEDGAPVLRMRRGRAGGERVLARGALSAAWSGGGLAYFRALRAELRDPRRYVGHVVVRRPSGGPAVRWTRAPARYVVAAWAGRRLLVYRLKEGRPDLLVLDGPARNRVLAPASGLVALSPDGRRAVLTRLGSSPPRLALVDVASGRTAAELVLPRGVRWVSESGSWAGGVVVAPAGAGAVVLRARGRGLALDRVLRLDQAAYPGGLRETRLDGSGRRFAAWAELAARPRQAVARAVAVECGVETLRCAAVAEGDATEPPRPVYNPSRPPAGG